MTLGHGRALGNAPCSSWSLAQECTRLWLGHNPAVRESCLRQLGFSSSTKSPVEAVPVNQGELSIPCVSVLLPCCSSAGLCKGCVRVHLTLARKHLCATLKMHKLWVNWANWVVSSVPACPCSLCMPYPAAVQQCSNAALPSLSFPAPGTDTVPAVPWQCPTAAPGQPSLPAPAGQPPVPPSTASCHKSCSGAALLKTTTRLFIASSVLCCMAVRCQASRGPHLLQSP